MYDNGPYCDYRMIVRIEIPNEPGQFAELARVMAEEGASLGAIDIVQATAKTIEALNKLSLPAGVDIKIKASTR